MYVSKVLGLDMDSVFAKTDSKTNSENETSDAIFNKKSKNQKQVVDGEIVK